MRFITTGNSSINRGSLKNFTRRNIHSINQAYAILESRERVQMLVLIGLGLAGTIIEMLMVGMIPLSVSILADPATITKLPLASSLAERIMGFSEVELILFLASTILLISLVKLVFFVGKGYYALRVNNAIRGRISAQVLQSALRTHWAYHMRTNSSEIVRNCNAEVNEFISGILNSMQVIIASSLMLVGMTVLILLYLPPAALIAFCVLFVAVTTFLFTVRKMLSDAGVTNMHARKGMIQSINESVHNIIDSKMLGKESWFLNHYKNSVRNYTESLVKSGVINQAIPYVVELAAVVGLFAVVLILSASKGGIANAVAEVALVAVAILRIRQAVGVISGNVAKLNFSAPSINNLAKHSFSLLEEDLGEAVDFRFESKSLHIEQLSYRYPKTSAPVLDDVTIRIEPGTSVAFIGETGCGKSTLVHILASLLDPDVGRVLLGRYAVHEHKASWRSIVGFVPQHVNLIDTTIEQNIAFGEKDVDRDRLRMAIELSQLKPVIDDQLNGLKTIVGEHGIRLSGGQKQRIGIARALYRQPKVLILDEATSALDQQTEAKITESLERLPWRVTRIVVAHRLSTIEHCDQIVRLEHGRVAETGTYRELFSEPGADTLALGGGC